MQGSTETEKGTSAVLEEEACQDDDAIVHRILNGDKNAFRHLVVAHQNQVYALLMRQLGDASIAEDLTQEVLIKAFTSLPSFRFEAKFSTWLSRIAMNTAHSYFASRRYRQNQKTASLEEVTLPPAALYASDSIDADALESLRKAAESLKPKMREVFMLCALEQRSYQEAAEILELPVGTVRSRLHHARLFVRKRYLKG